MSSKNIIKLIFSTILLSLFIKHVHLCQKKVINDAGERVNSYSGNEFTLYGSELCKNSMILECKDANLRKIDMVDLTFANVLPMTSRSRLTRHFMKRDIDGDPDVPARTSAYLILTPESGDNFVIEGSVKFATVDDSNESTFKFKSTGRSTSFDVELTCLDESLDKLETVYVDRESISWTNTMSDCTPASDNCSQVKSIVEKKIVNSLTVAVRKLVERLVLTGKPN